MLPEGREPGFVAGVEREAEQGPYATTLSGQVADQLGFREDTGGFDVKKTEDATPTKFVALVKERGGEQYARVVLELDASNRVRVFDITGVPTPAE